MKTWVNCELPKETAGRLKEYLRDMHIDYEPSECGDLIHFECHMSIEEQIAANEFIQANC